MADTPKHSVSVAGIVVDDQHRVLVIQRRDNERWEPPGGILELDEEPEVGVAREIKEETGLSVEVGELSGVYKNMTMGVVALVFRCKPTGGRLRASQESAVVAWLDVTEVKASMPSAYSVRVSDALGSGTFVRSHDGESLLDRPPVRSATLD